MRKLISLAVLLSGLLAILAPAYLVSVTRVSLPMPLLVYMAILQVCGLCVSLHALSNMRQA